MGSSSQFFQSVSRPRPRVEQARCLLAARLASVVALCLTLAAPAAAQADAPERYLPQSFFQHRVSGAQAIDSESDQLVKELRNMAFGVDPKTDFNCRSAVEKGSPTKWTAEEQANCQRVTTRAGISRDDYAPVVYTVPADQPRVPIVLDNYNPSLKRALAEGVPLPDGARPATGTDGQMIVWQPSTDTMWEFWRPYQDAEGAWHTTWGGRMQNVSDNPGHFQSTPDPAGAELPSAKRAKLGLNLEEHRWGGPATSIPNLPGIMTVDQLRSGEIGHALVFATWAAKPDEWVYPAQRTDGRCRGSAGQYCTAIPEGARFRLDPDFDTETISHPLVRMMAEAVQDYGMVLNNQTGGGANFYAEGWRQHGWEDPYYGPGGLFRSDPDQLAPTQFMREFPWEALQLLERGTTCTDRNSPCEAPAGWLEANEPSADAAERRFGMVAEAARAAAAAAAAAAAGLREGATRR